MSSESTLDVVVYGTIAVSNLVRLPAAPRGTRPAVATADYYNLGGGALESAVPLAAWGWHVGVAGNKVGEDAYADFILQELARFPRIDRRWIEQEPRIRTPFSRIFTTPGGIALTVDYWLEQLTPRPLGQEMLHGARVLATDGKGGRERVNAARLAHEHGLTVVATDIIESGHEMLPFCDWVITSRAALARRYPDVTPEDHLANLHARNPRATFVVTQGRRPVQVMTPEGELLRVRGYPVPALDPLGAGEIFRAGVIHALLEGHALLETIRFASAASALWVTQSAALRRPPPLERIRLLQEERPGRAVEPEGPVEERVQCPICRRWRAAALFEMHWRMDRRLSRVLREENPAWRRVEGACPSCIHRAIGPAGLTRATADMPRDLEAHPIYGSGEPHALPLVVRLRANPHLAGRGVTMAFLDSGFYPHPDLTLPENRIVRSVDATTDDVVDRADFDVPTLMSWHGMMTSVVAAGNGHLSQGYYAGLASEARLVLVKVSDPKMRINEVDILRGLRWLAANHAQYGVRVVNLSVGGDPGLRPRSPLNRLVNELVEAGLTIVAAAGNMGRDDLCPPASAAGAITVGGLDDRNTLDPRTNRIWHSNWGRIDESTLKPELIAPSIWVAAPVLPGTPTAEQNSILASLHHTGDRELPELLAGSLLDLGLDPSLLDEPVEAMRLAVHQKLIANKFISPFYQHVDGTSFAAPIVSGVVAQMLEGNPALTPARVKELLIATADRLPGVPEERQGYGVVRPGLAVAAALHERYGPYEPGNLSPRLTEESVRFILHEPRARRASVIGLWNEWDPAALPMEEREEGVWVAEMARPAAGRYPYKFLLDDNRWLDDPENPRKAVDGYGGFDSVLMVGE